MKWFICKLHVPKVTEERSYVLWINRFSWVTKSFFSKANCKNFKKKSLITWGPDTDGNTVYFFFFVKSFIWTPKIFTSSSVVTVLHHVRELSWLILVTRWLFMCTLTLSQIPSSAVVCAVPSPLDIPCLGLQSNVEEFSTTGVIFQHAVWEIAG